MNENTVGKQKWSDSVATHNSYNEEACTKSTPRPRAEYRSERRRDTSTAKRMANRNEGEDMSRGERIKREGGGVPNFNRDGPLV